MSFLEKNISEQRALIQLVPQQRRAPIAGKANQIFFSRQNLPSRLENLLFLPVAVDIPKSKHRRIHIVVTQKGQHVAIHIRLQKIVAVRKAQVFPSGRPQSCVFCRRRAAVFLVDDPNAAVPLGVSIADGAGIVSGAVIDKDDLQLFVVLRQDAVQTLRQIGRYVIYRYNDRNHVLHS